MSALADFAHKFGSSESARELKIGQSFFNDANSVFHTIRYDFVPASVDPNKTSALDIDQKGKVTVTVPNLEGSGTTESVYQGQRKAHQKECVLIINNETGDIILEKLNTSMIVKKARLRQEDLTGKSLALNKSRHNGNGNGFSSSSSSSSGTQSKTLLNGDNSGGGGGHSSQNNKKSSSLTTAAALKTGAKSYQKSPPLLSSTSSHASPNNATFGGMRSSNGHYQPTTAAKTPSPPSMPIFSAAKGTLVHTNGAPAVTTPPLELHVTTKLSSNEPPSHNSKPNRTSVANLANNSGRLSEDSSSDSSDDEDNNSDEESSSSQASSDSSEDERKSSRTRTPRPLTRPSPSDKSNSSRPPPSMPTLMSMPTSLAALASSSGGLALSGNDSNGSSSNVTASNELVNKSSLALTLSEESSDDDELNNDRRHEKRPLPKPSVIAAVNGNSSKHTKHHHQNGKDLLSTPNNNSNNKPFPEGSSPVTAAAASMPKLFTGNGIGVSSNTSQRTSPSEPVPLPKYSQLTQDLQLSESSGSDSDDY